MKLKNFHTNKIQEYLIPSPAQRSEIYFNAAYKRIFKQEIKGGCEALSFAANDRLYQVFTGCYNLPRRYKKVYSELYPEFMLFENKATRNWYWFSDGEEGKEERIIAFLLCAEMVRDNQINNG